MVSGIPLIVGLGTRKLGSLCLSGLGAPILVPSSELALDADADAGADAEDEGEGEEGGGGGGGGGGGRRR